MLRLSLMHASLAVNSQPVRGWDAPPAQLMLCA